MISCVYVFMLLFAVCVVLLDGVPLLRGAAGRGGSGNSFATCKFDITSFGDWQVVITPFVFLPRDWPMFQIEALEAPTSRMLTSWTFADIRSAHLRPYDDRA